MTWQIYVNRFPRSGGCERLYDLIITWELCTEWHAEKNSRTVQLDWSVLIFSKNSAVSLPLKLNFPIEWGRVGSRGWCKHREHERFGRARGAPSPRPPHDPRKRGLFVDRVWHTLYLVLVPRIALNQAIPSLVSLSFMIFDHRNSNLSIISFYVCVLL